MSASLVGSEMCIRDRIQRVGPFRRSLMWLVKVSSGPKNQLERATVPVCARSQMALSAVRNRRRSATSFAALPGAG
eukprot:1097213-Alexandrium_andersonii.AAC.1